MLSHATAAWSRLLDDPPRLIHVSTPRQCCSQPGIKVHARRTHERVRHRGFPTTTLPQTLLDLAAHEPLRTARRARARADYSRLLEIAAVEAILGRGRRGSRTLAAALAEHQPRFARTRSQNEILFLEICEAAGIPMPEVNVRVAGWEVDALWRAERIAVEIDGYGNHRSRARVRRDRQKDLALRSHGYTPLRYSDEQIYDHRDEVIADLRRASGA